jgi:hypothetical protein
MYQSPEYTTAHVVIPPGDNPLPSRGSGNRGPIVKNPKKPIFPPPPRGGGGGVPLYKRLEMTLSGRGKKVVHGRHREISVSQTERPLGIDAFVTELCKIRVA